MKKCRKKPILQPKQIFLYPHFQLFLMDDLGLFCLYLRYFPSYQLRSLSIWKLRLWGFWKYVTFFEKHWPGLSISHFKKSNPWKKTIFDKKFYFGWRFFHFRPKNFDKKKFHISIEWRIFSDPVLFSKFWSPFFRAPTLIYFQTEFSYTG